MTDLQVYDPPAVEQYQARLTMTPSEARLLDEQLRACTRAVLREGTDYGVIPGTGDSRKTLLKPGAEKLLQWFGLGFTCHQQGGIELDAEGRKQGVTYRCTVLKRMPDGTSVDVATSEGYAGYDEPKYYKTAQENQAAAEARERMWAKKDHRVANPEKWKHAGEYRAPWNTIIKMAQKRAIVGATIDATAAAGLFTEEEDHGPADDSGQTFYQKALAQAASFTDIEDLKALWTDAADAAKNGLCTPKDATHIQNRITARLKELKGKTVVDTENLAGGEGDE